MGALIDSGKHLVLNNRYALLGCIAVSGAGKIYRGRDLEQVKHQGLESRILIHVLPPQASQWALDELFQHINVTTQRMALPWILAPLAYGHDNGQAYVVLESPDTWELQSFLTQAGQQSPCQQNALKNLKPLIKKRYLDENLDPALLLCVAGTNVYVLATALSPQVQQLEKRGTHRVIPRKYIGQALMTGSLLTLFGIFTAVAGNAVLEIVVTPETASVLPMNRKQQVYTDTPLMKITPLPVTKVESKMLTSPAPPVVAKPTVKQQPLPAQQPATAESAPVKKVTPAAMPEKTLTEQVPNTDTASPQADNGIDSLIQRAYAAMDAGNIGYGRGSTLHFTRTLREQSPNHPQVARLGQEMAAATLRQIRVALQTQNLEQAERLLPMSRQLIQEFNLKHLQAAQQVLEDKTLELRIHS